MQLSSKFRTQWSGNAKAAYRLFRRYYSDFMRSY